MADRGGRRDERIDQAARWCLTLVLREGEDGGQDRGGLVRGGAEHGAANPDVVRVRHRDRGQCRAGRRLVPFAEAQRGLETDGDFRVIGQPGECRPEAWVLADPVAGDPGRLSANAGVAVGEGQEHEIGGQDVQSIQRAEGLRPCLRTLGRLGEDGQRFGRRRVSTLQQEALNECRESGRSGCRERWRGPASAGRRASGPREAGHPCGRHGRCGPCRNRPGRRVWQAGRG